MSSARPPFKTSEIPSIIQQNFGLITTVETELDSYDDQNFFMRAIPGSPNPENIPCVSEHGYVLKILNFYSSKRPDIIDAQTKMIIHVAKEGYPTPSPVLSVNQRYMEQVSVFHDNHQGSSESKYIIRLFNFKPGKVLLKVPLTPQLCYEIGWFAGKMDTLLQKCSIDSCVLNAMTNRWNLSEVPSLRRDTQIIECAEQRRVIEEVIDQFEKRILGCASSFSQGLIHGDFNDCNILVEEGTSISSEIDCGQKHQSLSALELESNRADCEEHNNKTCEYHVCGVIDFGDATHSLYIFELAIAIAYLMINNSNIASMEAARKVLMGYMKHVQLSDWELLHLKLTICARFAQSLVLGQVSFLQDPGNEYILIHAKKIWPVLKDLWQKSDSEVFSALMGK